MNESIINRNNLDKAYVITQYQHITGREFLKFVQQYSLLINNFGYTKVGIYAENRVEWIYAFYAALQSNCIAVPIDYMASDTDVAYIIEDCQPELLFVSSAMEESWLKVKEKSHYHPKIIRFEDYPPDINTPESSWFGPENNDTTAVIIYTSGTTGSPKGVMLSFSNIIST